MPRQLGFRKDVRLKPQAGTPLNWASPHARGLLWLGMPGSDNRIEHVGGGRPTPAATTALGALTPLGQAAANSGSAGGVNYPASSRLAPLNQVTTFTIIVWAAITANNGFNYNLFMVGDNGGFTTLGFGEWNAGEPQLSYVDSSFTGNNGVQGGGSTNFFISDGVLHQYAVTRNGPTVNYYRDGIFWGTQTISNGGANLALNSSISTETIGLFGKTTGGATAPSNTGKCLYGGVWSIDGSRGLVQSNFLQPFGMFEMPQTKIPLVPAATGGIVTFPIIAKMVGQGQASTTTNQLKQFQNKIVSSGQVSDVALQKKMLSANIAAQGQAKNTTGLAYNIRINLQAGGVVKDTVIRSNNIQNFLQGAAVIKDTVIKSNNVQNFIKADSTVKTIPTKNSTLQNFIQAGSQVRSTMTTGVQKALQMFLQSASTVKNISTKNSTLQNFLKSDSAVKTIPTKNSTLQNFIQAGSQVTNTLGTGVAQLVIRSFLQGSAAVKSVLTKPSTLQARITGSELSQVSPMGVKTLQVKISASATQAQTPVKSFVTGARLAGQGVVKTIAAKSNVLNVAIKAGSQARAVSLKNSLLTAKIIGRSVLKSILGVPAINAPRPKAVYIELDQAGAKIITIAAPVASVIELSENRARPVTIAQAGAKIYTIETPSAIFKDVE